MAQADCQGTANWFAPGARVNGVAAAVEDGLVSEAARSPAASTTCRTMSKARIMARPYHRRVPYGPPGLHVDVQSIPRSAALITNFQVPWADSNLDMGDNSSYE
jgi:hypothetical protein